ncbi:sigma-54-dependent transcriptional regulator [Neotabrizicola sp. VNH66]|uniref:sigma-54-dependent transcriptional regulator n=1 Tax=Neotabrizicola sp. VNH66 TaxID=3400918 RepID=UPI003BFCDCB4
MTAAARTAEPAAQKLPASDFGPALAQAAILVVDDEPGMRHFLQRVLGGRCRTLEVASSTAEAGGKLAAGHFDVVILDNIMQGKRGVDWLAEQRASGFFPPAILITAYADLETAIQALQAGASDFVLKPFRSNQILNAVARCLERVRLERENHVLRHELKAHADHILLRDRLIGASAAIEAIRDTIARVAPLPSTVLLTGPSGSGKEVAARMIHQLSDRAERPFVPVNCAAIPHDMVETELFGHLKGAFTGAVQTRDGLFLHARGGTLFLDEIGELPLPVQAKLLRVIEDRRVRPLGSEREVPVDVRLLCATNADLDRAVAEGRFRADLLYRINVLTLDMPPLCERGSDVQDLADLFMQKLSVQLGMPPVPIDGAVRAGLQAYRWPGNVRELRNLIERALILGRFPPDFSATSAQLPPVTLAEIERQAILTTLDATGGDREAAALRLGISRKTIDRRLSGGHG